MISSETFYDHFFFLPRQALDLWRLNPRDRDTKRCNFVTSEYKVPN